MPLESGSQLGPYEILGPLGAGGMGEVYRARDGRLGRDVAIKVLPEAVAADRERVARFEREAKTLAALNHPNIAAIYGFEDSHSVKALVMELVDGPTLADRIAQGTITVDDALGMAKQIAEALEAAHEQGIIHRDLKPANIKVRPDGTVKVLDFGLAKALGPETATASAGSPSMSPTITTPAYLHGGQAMTQAGMILGTAAYMAPEQARGQAADRRCDLWAFGCVLYEMLTGARAFDGSTVSDTLAAVLKTEPDWTRLPATAPPTLRRLLGRCLQKDRKLRLDSAAAARIEIADALTEPSQGTAAAAAHPARQRVAAIVAAALALGAVGSGAAVWMLRQPVPPRVASLAVPLPAERPLFGSVALSPDGTLLAMSAGNQIVLRHLERNELTPLPGTEGGVAPFFSPDGAWVGFSVGFELRKIRVDGTNLLTIGRASRPATSAFWSADDTVLFSAGNALGLFRVPASGGESAILTEPQRDAGESVHLQPQVLPGGSTVLFTIVRTGGPTAAILSLDSSTWRAIPEIKGRGAHYLASGHVVYQSGETLLAVAFDPATGTVRGTPMPILDGISDAGFAVADDGTLAYPSGTLRLQSGSLVTVDRAGKVSPVAEGEDVVINGTGGGSSLSLSRDGRFAAMGLERDRSSQPTSDIWIFDLSQGTRSRVTSEGGINTFPQWSPDGKEIVFRSRRDPEGLYRQTVGETSTPKLMLRSDGVAQFPNVWLPNALGLLYLVVDPRTGTDVWWLTNDGKTKPLLATPAGEVGVDVSPDGRWIAYASDISGQREVYVAAFPSLSGTQVVSADGGTDPKWIGTHELLYQRPRRGTSVSQIVSVPLTIGEALRLGRPQVLFDMAVVGAYWDVSADGKRFIALQPPRREAGGGQVNVILNWNEEMKRLVPAP